MAATANGKAKKTITKNRLPEMEEPIRITAPNFKRVSVAIRGTSPYVQQKFSEESRRKMEETQTAGSKQAKKKTQKDPKDFDALFVAAQYRSDEGWHGIPAGAFRAAMVRACKLAGFAMTDGKQCLHVEADGMDEETGTPLVRIYGGQPEKSVMPVRLPNGVMDLRVRPMWKKWQAKPVVRFDADTFTATDIANLMMRVGVQVGIGEGRPMSPKGNGMGWGMFELDA